MPADQFKPPQFSLRAIFVLMAIVAVFCTISGQAGLFVPLVAVGIAAPVAILVLLGRWILGPLDRAARNKRCPVQFTLVDFLALMFLFQLPMAFIHSFASVNESPLTLPFDIFGWFACAAMWALSVTTLSRAGIESRRHRALFLTLVLPVVYFGSIAFIGIGAGLIIVPVRRPGDTAALMAGLALAELVLAAAFYLAARFVRRMVAAAQPGSNDAA